VSGVTAGSPVAEESAAENAVSEACAPRSAVENTPAGIVALAVENVLVETQKELSVAAVSPFVALSVALVEVIAVAALVVGPVVAETSVANAPSAPTRTIPVATEAILTC
jgi:hypothetical protein